MPSAAGAIEIEVLGARRAQGRISPAQVRRLCELVAAERGVQAGHVAVQFVPAARIAALNARHRGREAPTDVLSFPIDGAGPLAAADARELGDIVICPEHAADLAEAVVHGMLHLLGMDHERDDGEMLALQDRLMQAAASRAR